MNWKKFKRDMKERFLNSETARGLFVAPAGVVLLYVTLFHLQFAIQTAFALVSLYCIYDGVRKILVNRIKQKINRDKLIKDRLNATEAN